MTSIDTILNILSKKTVGNTSYYQLISLEEYLRNSKIDVISLSEWTALPFYFCEKGVLELYDFELNIRRNEQPDMNRLILEKTGRQRIEDVFPAIRLKLEACTIELTNKEKGITRERLLQYLAFVKNAKELEQRIGQLGEVYTPAKLYFESF